VCTQNDEQEGMCEASSRLRYKIASEQQYENFIVQKICDGFGNIYEYSQNNNSIIIYICDEVLNYTFPAIW
jgi:hypothetical protein